MPILSNVTAAIDRHLRAVTCLKYTGETIASNGEATDSAYTSSTKQMAVLPISQKELQTMPNGLYDKFDRKAYCKDTSDLLPNESLLDTDFGRFKIMSTDNRYFEADFVVYYCKKVIQ